MLKTFQLKLQGEREKVSQKRKGRSEIKKKESGWGGGRGVHPSKFPGELGGAGGLSVFWG